MFYLRNKKLQELRNSLENTKICFLIGARQIGKTTLLKKFMKEIQAKKNISAVFLSCDEVSLKKFESAREMLQYFSFEKGIDFTNVTHLFLDEVQLVENISLFLKDLHDNYPFKIFASGSGSFKIFSGISESLIGRKEVIKMYPFSFQEFLLSQNVPYVPFSQTTNTSILAYEKKAEEFLLYGGYPEVLLQKTPEKKIITLKNLYKSYSEQDIRYYIQQKELSAFDAFYSQITGSIGSLLKIDSFCQKLSISRKKVEEFRFLLENTFLGIFLPPFSQNKAKEVISHQKIFFSDTGFINSVWQNFSLSPERKGILIENFVLNEFQKNFSQLIDIFFWRKKSQTEIDFLLKNQLTGKIIPVEVKSSSTDVIPKAFRSFFEDYGDNIQYGVILNKDQYKMREFMGKKIFILPYFYADSVLDLS
jgi:predicted AAA+ superfamily ATPase